jgi:hypothetical protein
MCLQPLMIDLKQLLGRVYEKSAILGASFVLAKLLPAWTGTPAQASTESLRELFGRFQTD